MIQNSQSLSKFAAGSVCVIADNDADRRTIQGLGLEIQAQLQRLPDAIKINQSVLFENIPAVIYWLKHCSCPVVLDLALPFSELNEQKRGEVSRFFPFADVLILDRYQAEIILKREMKTPQSLEEAANELHALGVKSILFAGIIFESSWNHDYWSNGTTSFWLTHRRFSEVDHPEVISILSAALVAFLALGYSLEDAVVLARMYANQAIRLAHMSLYYGGFPESELDLPYLASTPIYHVPQPFKSCHRLGLYPIVDSFSWVELLLNLGVKTIQLRIKGCTNILEAEVQRSILLAKKYKATLFINDHWELALKLHAEAVHLGQSDLDTADIESLRHQGLLLGVSTHCYYEVARAHALCPSYMAIGPIYPTRSKEMFFAAQGIARLSRWQRTLSYPLVAIGGINFERMPDVVATGVQGIALISAIIAAEDPRGMTQKLLNLID